MTCYIKMLHFEAVKVVNIHHDASSLGVNTVIYHTSSNGKENVITYTSCKLSQAAKIDAKIQ